jgi:predicted DNA-binding protein with PD1-like motif
MPITSVGQFGRVGFGIVEPGEDVYRSIQTAIEREGMKNGVILSITGGLAHTRLSMPIEADALEVPPKIFEKDTNSEATGNGYFFEAMDTYDESASGVIYEKGRIVLHVHMTISGFGENRHAHCGHLIDGCQVRSVHPKSHFAFVFAEVLGPRLTFHVSEETTEHYRRGIPYYDLS